MNKLTRAALLVAVLSSVTVASRLDFSGQASGWLGASRDTSLLGVAGLRYLPGGRFSLSLGKGYTLDAEASVSGLASAEARSERSEVEARIKPYRGFVRLSTARFESRAGLQKINFGSATLLRPLQWFDRIDPRDPLELTDGVYGLLGRYYFQNNANVWAWGLLGNSSPKGWEIYGSQRWNLEPGARVQVPLPRGEAALTYHHRRYRSRTITPEPAVYAVSEDRLGFDGKWDILVGLWLEATMGLQVDEARWDSMWQRAATVGMDYTFGLGNGLGVLAEHLVFDNATAAFGSGERLQASAVMVSYPLGLLDNLRAIMLYDWRNKGVYSFVGWQRTLDSWLFSATAFWNPDTPASLGAPGGGAAGKGIQLMVVFNH